MVLVPKGNDEAAAKKSADDLLASLKNGKLKSIEKQKIYTDMDISKGQRSQLKALPTDNAGTIRQQYKLNNIRL